MKDHELCLVGTSEISLAAMHINQMYDLNQQGPIKLVGFSHCFRAETGGGTYPFFLNSHPYLLTLDTYNRGLYRVHQFSKVEIFAISFLLLYFLNKIFDLTYICSPETSDSLHQEILQIEEDMYAELGFHFKILGIVFLFFMFK